MNLWKRRQRFRIQNIKSMVQTIDYILLSTKKMALVLIGKSSERRR